MNFQQFNERFGPIQNPYSGPPGLGNLLFMPGTQAMNVVQTSPFGHIWTLLRVDDRRVLVNSFVTTDNRIGHMLTTLAFEHDEHFEVDLPDDFPEVS
jgi:hypothetical protein